MIHSVYFDYISFLIFLCAGLVAGVCYGLIKASIIQCKNAIVVHIVEGIAPVVIGAIFFMTMNFYNYGVFRLFLFLTYFMGFYIERKTVGKMIAKYYLLFYNKLNKWRSNIRKSQAYKVIFK